MDKPHISKWVERFTSKRHFLEQTSCPLPSGCPRHGQDQASGTMGKIPGHRALTGLFQSWALMLFPSSPFRGVVLGLGAFLPPIRPVRRPTKNERVMLLSGELAQGASRPPQAVCTDTAVPPYPHGRHARTPGRCLRPEIVPNLIYATLSLYIHAFDKV